MDNEAFHTEADGVAVDILHMAKVGLYSDSLEACMRLVEGGRRSAAAAAGLRLREACDQWAIVEDDIHLDRSEDGLSSGESQAGHWRQLDFVGQMCQGWTLAVWLRGGKVLNVDERASGQNEKGQMTAPVSLLSIRCVRRLVIKQKMCDEGPTT